MSDFDWGKESFPVGEHESFDWEKDSVPAPDAEGVRSSSAAPGQPEPKDRGLWNAMSRSFLQGFFKGGSDEAVGGITRAAQSPGVGWRQPDGSVKFLAEPGDVYRAGRDSAREDLRSAEAHHRRPSMVADIAGDLTSDFVLNELGVPVGTTAYNTLSGALSGFNRSDAELSTEQVAPTDMAKAALGTGLGGAMGYALPKVGERAVKLAGPVLRAVGSKLEGLGIAQGRRALLNGADSLSKRLTSDDSVREALRSGSILPFGTTQGAANRLKQMVESIGDVYGEIVSELEKRGVQGPNARALADELFEHGRRLEPHTMNKKLPQEFLEQANNVLDKSVIAEKEGIASTGRLGLVQAENLKRSLQDEAFYGKTEETKLNEVRREIASIFRQANEDAIDTAAKNSIDPEVIERAESFVPVKQRLGRFLEAEKAASRGAQKAENRSAIGLKETMLAASTGDPVTGAAVAIGSRIANNRGPSTVASGAYWGGRAVRALGNATSTEQGRFLGKELSAASERSGLEPKLEDAILPRIFNQNPSFQMVQRIVSTNPDALGRYGRSLKAASERGQDSLIVSFKVLMDTDPSFRTTLEKLEKEYSDSQQP